VQLSLDDNSGIFVKAFADGELRVGNEIITAPVILTPRDIIADWDPPAVAELRVEHFAAALAADPEVILLGTGTSQLFPATTLLTDVMRQGIGFEVMATAAACRTFNVLGAEGRRVVAALFI
jgi:uncharacterized protein